MGIKQFNLAALLDFPNVIKPNESNPDSETSNFAAVWTHVLVTKRTYSVPQVVFNLGSTSRIIHSYPFIHFSPFLCRATVLCLKCEDIFL